MPTLTALASHRFGPRVSERSCTKNSSSLSLVSMALQTRDEEILCALTDKVRLLSLGQIARVWWTIEAQQTARRRLRKLEDVGLLERARVLANPMTELARPLFAWKPGRAEPDVDALAYTLATRWDSAPPRLTTVYFATQAAVERNDGCQAGFFAHPDDATHDLHVSELYLQLVTKHPELALFWRSEDELPEPELYGFKPDAALIKDDGRTRLFIEFGGRYKASRLTKIHRYCEKREVPYDLW